RDVPRVRAVVVPLPCLRMILVPPVAERLLIIAEHLGPVVDLAGALPFVALPEAELAIGRLGRLGIGHQFRRGALTRKVGQFCPALIKVVIAAAPPVAIIILIASTLVAVVFVVFIRIFLIATTLNEGRKVRRCVRAA